MRSNVDLKDNVQEVHDAVFDTGVMDPQYFWWRDLLPQHKAASDGTVPSYWGYRLIADIPSGPEDDEPDEDAATPTAEVEIWHTTVVEVMEKILAGDFSDESKLPEGRGPVSEGTVAACERLRDDPEYGSTAFDHWISDEILQVIAYGGIVW